ncbi:MAG: hypothetical protein QM737_23210 [Ferruginibacter sp.]
MKKISLLIVITCGIFIFNGCKKDLVDTKNTETVPQGIKPDLTTQVSAGIAGFITDENGAAVTGAEVKTGTVTSTTDTYGHFRIANTSFAKSAGFVQVTKQGYFTGFRTFLPSPNKETFVRLQLITKTITGNVNSSAGGTINTNDGASITLPADAVVVKGSNASYTGTVNIAAHWLDPSNTNVTLQTMPGDLRGIDESGYLQSLTTYGMLAVELSSDAGEQLQIANGKLASLKIPIPSQMQADAPESMPLWYFDETNGLWKQDGIGTKTGGNYEAQVSHFTTWNWDFPSPSINLTGQVLSSTSEPLINVPVKITSTIPNVPPRVGVYYTDTSGLINCQIPANTQNHLEVLNACNNSVHTQDFSTQTNDFNLEVIKINPGPNEAKITGTVLNCNNTPVTNGFVFLSDQNGMTQSAYVHNGIFNLSLFYCNSTMTCIAIDSDNMQQSISQQVNLINGNNDLGSIITCGSGTLEYLAVIVDGVSQGVLTIDPNGGGFAGFDSPAQTRLAWDNPGGQSVANLYFSGLPITGTHTDAHGVVCGPSYQRYEIQLTTQTVREVTITEYGPPITGFISGNFRLLCWAYPFAPIHDVQCDFRFRRTY